MRDSALYSKRKRGRCSRRIKGKKRDQSSTILEGEKGAATPLEGKKKRPHQRKKRGAHFERFVKGDIERCFGKDEGWS